MIMTRHDYAYCTISWCLSLMYICLAQIPSNILFLPLLSCVPNRSPSSSYPLGSFTCLHSVELLLFHTLYNQALLIRTYLVFFYTTICRLHSFRFLSIDSLYRVPFGIPLSIHSVLHLVSELRSFVIWYWWLSIVLFTILLTLTHEAYDDDSWLRPHLICLLYDQIMPSSHVYILGSDAL